MKVMTVLGTRPEIIRLCRVIPRLDRACDHVLVHTGQNFDPRLSEVFLTELGVRAPDLTLEARGPFAEQVGAILTGVDRVLEAERPDRVLILGDTNSGLAALVARRRGLPVYHMEAGNRCFDDRVPEEANRRVIDHCSDVLLPYTERSRQNLLREGIPPQRIFVTGNPIFEVLEHFRDRIDASDALVRLGVAPGGFFLATLHRAENVDSPARLAGLMEGLQRVAREFSRPVLVSTHPRLRDRLGGATSGEGVRFLEPFGFFDFVRLERTAAGVLSDSGTVQEECTIFGVPAVTLRDVTERPETLEHGANLLAGADPDRIVRCLRAALDREPVGVPPEYLRPAVSQVVANLLLS